MNVAARVRQQKEQHPEYFCPVANCLWRTSTREGYKPCAKHGHIPVYRNEKDRPIKAEAEQ